MNAWLITWEGIGNFAKVRDPFIAILGNRRGSTSVKEFVEQYYLRATSSLEELAAYANRPGKIPYKARLMTCEGSPLDYAITCGNNPWIYARKVSDLVVSAPSKDSRDEIISWKEPDFLTLDRRTDEVRIVHFGRYKEVTRSVRYPIDNLCISP